MANNLKSVHLVSSEGNKLNQYRKFEWNSKKNIIIILIAIFVIVIGLLVYVNFHHKYLRDIGDIVKVGVSLEMITSGIMSFIHYNYYRPILKLSKIGFNLKDIRVTSYIGETELKIYQDILKSFGITKENHINIITCLKSSAEKATYSDPIAVAIGMTSFSTVATGIIAWATTHPAAKGLSGLSVVPWIVILAIWVILMILLSELRISSSIRQHSMAFTLILESQPQASQNEILATVGSRKERHKRKGWLYKN